jgi:anaphase-promoting complex subunit 6
MDYFPNYRLQCRLKNWDLVLEATTEAALTALAATPDILSQIYHLRGLGHLDASNRELARQAFEEALKSDVTCFDSLDQLLVNHMLSVEQGMISACLFASEQNLVNSLDFAQAGDMSDLLKSVYLSKLQKYQIPNAIEPILTKLERKFDLVDSFTVQIERADALFSICKFKDCLKLTTSLYVFVL